MKDSAIFLPILGIILAFIFLTVAEIFVLKFSKRVDSPKFIWFPVSANIASSVIVGLLILLAVILFAVGFIVAFDSGYNSGEKYFYLMIFALILIPILLFIVRTILFLIFKLGKFPMGLLYSLITTVINVAVVSISALVFLGIYENFLR